MKNLAVIIVLTFFIFSSCEDKKNEPKILEEIICDGEKIDTTKGLFVAPVKFIETTFSNSKKQSSDKAHSGKYSIKLDKNNQFGFAYTLFNVKANEHYRISVWRYSQSGKGALGVSHKDKKFFADQKAVAVKEDSKWEQLVLDFVIPENIDGEDLRAYCWNPDTVNPVYFDDLKISLIENLPQK